MSPRTPSPLARERAERAEAEAAATVTVWRNVLRHYRAGTNPPHMTRDRIARDTPGVLADIHRAAATAARWATTAARNADTDAHDADAMAAAAVAARIRRSARVLERDAEAAGFPTR